MAGKKIEKLKLKLPMKFDEAVSDLLKVKPPKKKKTQIASKRNKK